MHSCFMDMLCFLIFIKALPLKLPLLSDHKEMGFAGITEIISFEKMRWIAEETELSCCSCILRLTNFNLLTVVRANHLITILAITRLAALVLLGPPLDTDPNI